MYDREDELAEPASLTLLPMALAQLVLDHGSPYPMYEQICQCVRVAIAGGELPPGSMLPPARLLAERLKVGRNTIVAAYGRLAAEGYVTTNTRRGTRVAETAIHQMAPTADADSGEPFTSTCAISARGISFRARHWLQEADDRRAVAALQAVRGPDPSLYPRVGLARLVTEEFGKPVSDDAGAVQRFQNAICSLVRHMRGIKCTPEQIVPVASCAQGFDLVARLLLDPGDCVYVEEAMDPSLRQSLELAGAQLVSVPCDGQGADVAKTNGPPPRLIVVCPSANFPLGRQMSDLRRKALVEFAESYGAAILEWDRCWGLSYTGGRNPAIHTQARAGSVLYFDTLFESLGAHSRLGYLIVPTSMAESFTRMAEQTASGPACFLLSAVARFVEGHQYKVHLSDVRTVYARRLRRLSDLCRATLHDVRVIEPNAGYTLTIEFPDRLDDTAICRLVGSNLPIAPLSRFFHPAQGTRATGIVVGAAAMTERLLETTVRQIRDAIAQTRSAGIRSNRSIARQDSELLSELAS